MVKVLLHLLISILLTLVSQIGGIIYLLSISLTKYFKVLKGRTIGVFIGLYIISSLTTVLIAPIFGRSALPISGNLRPLNYLTVVLNRHYVNTSLKNELLEIADSFSSKYAESKIQYLDANFPFIDGFPLFPHLSHDDGKKIDLAFNYLLNEKNTNSTPALFGYGAFERPQPNEANYPEKCSNDGFWQYSILSLMDPIKDKGYEVNVDQTRFLIKQLSSSELTSKIFIEPHLKSRWKLNKFENIRFHGCHAVRHDDHIHYQIK